MSSTSVITVDSIDALLQEIENRLGALDPDRRRLIAVAGPPAAGKSTLAESLRKRLPGSEIVPMDGFHLDNALLDLAGMRAVKGAPQTFDSDGLLALLPRLVDRHKTVHVPVFDRQADLSRASACAIQPQHHTLWIEGNYLLLDEAPWSSMMAAFDLSVSVHVPEDELHRRLVQRWVDHGLSEKAALERAEQNDMVNALRVVRGSRSADIVYDLCAT